MRAFMGLSPEAERIPVVLAEEFPAAQSDRPKKHGNSVRGEERPMEHPEHEPGKPEFFAVKMLRIDHAEDGTLRAWPIAGRPGSAATLAANAYYMLPTGTGIEAPKPGDIIWVEWR